ncbi:MAG: hypothetical protein JWO81_2136 [Alphaproteobacteria bacterium]|nr:hypothetical protein [Alphaproteobacteria bacterium]
MRRYSCLPAFAAFLALSWGQPALAADDADAAGGGGAGGACTGHPGTVRLYVDVQNVRSSTGLVAITLYADDSSRFLAHRGSLYVGRVPARQGNTRVCIWVPKAGIWAIVAYHDENANRKYDRNAIGLPKEGGGFSNNPSTFLGLPTFRSVRFPVHAPETEIRIRLKYP